MLIADDTAMLPGQRPTSWRKPSMTCWPRDPRYDIAQARRGRFASSRSTARIAQRAEIAAASLAGRGGIVLAADLSEAVELANSYAPEHLCLLVSDPWR